jgi:hypothetical protein
MSDRTPSDAQIRSRLADYLRRCAEDHGRVYLTPKDLRYIANALVSETSTREDPGMVKLLTNLVDRMYKMNLMAIPSLRVTEQNPDSNDPIAAWMSDVRSVLYRNKPVPDLARDLGNIK